MDDTIGGLQSIIFFQNFTTSCSIDLPMMLSIFVAEGGLSVLVLGGSGRGNEPTTNREGFELLVFCNKSP